VWIVLLHAGSFCITAGDPTLKRQSYGRPGTEPGWKDFDLSFSPTMAGFFALETRLWLDGSIKHVSNHARAWFLQ